jgi:mono/diheme cytochrome c family protein
MRPRQWKRALDAAILILGVIGLFASCQKRAQQPTSPSKVTTAVDSTTLAALDPGQQTFLTHCAVCHGTWGAGDGPLAADLEREAHIRPANLSDRERMSRLGRPELIRVIENGGGHTGRSNLMPPWSGKLDRQTIERVAEFVKQLPELSPATPPATIQAFLAAPPGSPPEGRHLFVYYCAMCHGAQGHGDGQLADTLFARNGIRPRDLTDSTYFAGRTDEQVYEVIALGGAHFHKSRFMPVWSVTLKPAQIKSLASYIRTISRTKSAR